jgi:hypothetical protein
LQPGLARDIPLIKRRGESRRIGKARKRLAPSALVRRVDEHTVDIEDRRRNRAGHTGHDGRPRQNAAALHIVGLRGTGAARRDRLPHDQRAISGKSSPWRHMYSWLHASRRDASSGPDSAFAMRFDLDQ